MRVVHLIQPCPSASGARRAEAMHDTQMSDSAVLACREAIEASPHLTHEVVVVGNAGAERRAAQLGVRSTVRISPPLNRSRFAAPALRAFLLSRCPGGLVQAWGAGFARLIENSLPRHFAWALADFDRGWIRGSAAPQDEVLLRVLPVNPRLELPPSESRTAVRRAFGIGDDETLVIAAGDPPSLVDAPLFMYFLSILTVAGMPSVGILPRGASNLARALQHIRGGGYARGVRLVDDPPILLIQGADLIVTPFAASTVRYPPYSAKLDVSRYLRSRLPVIIPDVLSLRELDPGQPEECIATSCRPSDMARAASVVLRGAARGPRPAAAGDRPAMHEVVLSLWAELDAGPIHAPEEQSSGVLVS